VKVASDSMALESHRRVVAELLDEARDHPAVIGALLIGSLGRGTALPGSDVDLLLLLADGRGTERLFRNHERHGVLVEYHFRDVATAQAQLEREPTWYYAYLNSRIIYDPTGRLAGLVAFAREHFPAYRATPEQKRRYAFMVDRTQHKLQAAVDAGDALRAGGVASTYAAVILDGLWTAHDRPHLGVSEMWVRLPDLDGFPAELAEHLRTLFLGAALERARAGIILCEWIVARLGGPVIDPYQE
jgi:predicted nucleotidyltransferase